MELTVLTTFNEDDSQNVYETFHINEEVFVVLCGYILDMGLVGFLEENGDEFRFFDPLNEEGWKLERSSLDLCFDIHLPPTCYELVLKIPDVDRRRKVKLFFKNGDYYLEEEGHLLWDD